MHRLLLSCALCLAASCSPAIAALPPVAASLPSSAPVFDFEEIPAGACVQEFSDGLFLSWPSARNLVIADRKRDIDHQLALLDRDEKIALSTGRAEHAEAALADAQSWLSRWGFPLGLGLGLLGGIGSAVAGWALSR